MSSVPEGRRTQSDFQARHNYFQLRDEVTRLMINDFGFDKEKYDAGIEKYRQAHAKDQNVDKIVERWKRKSDAFNKWFIDKECDAVLEILRRIESEFTYGNSIYPSDTPARLFEYLERRKHITAAIANCYILKQELQYIIRTLPVDMNKYYHYEKALKTQISLFKGVRQADNRFLKAKKKTVDVSKDITAISDCIIAIMNKTKGNS